MKFYAVKKGRKPGVYRTWAEAEAQVKGFPGAEFKAFKEISQATEYLNWNAQTQSQVLQSDEERLQAAVAKIKQNQRPVKPKKPQANGYFATIYTDGGTRNTSTYRGGHVKPTDKAAWAYLIEWDGQEVHQAGDELGASNNKMEQTALIEALKRLLKLGFQDRRLLFVLDSQYVLNAINKGWLKSWKKRGWRRASGPLANVPQWQELDRLLAKFSDTTFTWTKGHANNRGNEFVDHALNVYMDQMQ